MSIVLVKVVALTVVRLLAGRFPMGLKRPMKFLPTSIRTRRTLLLALMETNSGLLSPICH